MSTTWLPMECLPERRSGYAAEFRASGLGPMQVVVLDVPPATVRRTPDQPIQMMTFMFPPSLLPLSRNRIRQLAAVPFPAGAGLGDVTSQFLLQLARNVDHYSPAEAALLSAATLEVLATRLAHELDVHD
jgi:hypothetical protein